MEDGHSLEVIDEVESTIRKAAGVYTIVLIRIAVGKTVSIPKVTIASELHRRFPSASVVLMDSAITDSIVVKDIEVE